MSTGKHNNIPPGRLGGKLADIIEVFINGDYGADHEALSEDHMQLCHDNGVFLQKFNLMNPVEVSLAMIDSTKPQKETKFMLSKNAGITLTVSIESGPLRLRNLEFLGFPHTMDEILLSRPLLRRI